MRSPRRAELAALMPPKPVIDMSAMLVSPMPGVLVSVAVKEGDMVEEGQELAVVEAMKMANVLRSERKGRVRLAFGVSVLLLLLRLLCPLVCLRRCCARCCGCEGVGRVLCVRACV